MKNEKPLLGEIQSYWSRRADSYSAEVQYELTHKNEAVWMEVLEEYLKQAPGKEVLDAGTGPGFFAIGLAKRGYQVSAVDYTVNMLEQAMKNAGVFSEKIHFFQMDVQALEFSDGCFDAVVTRNLTWNLEHPDQAYREWHRVLRKGGVLLNFDAGWYNYLFDDEKAKEYEKDRNNVSNAGIHDFDAYSESAKMEEISRRLILSRCKRPEKDIEMLHAAGFEEVSVDMRIGDRVWDETEKVNYGSRPMFLLRARK